MSKEKSKPNPILKDIESQILDLVEDYHKQKDEILEILERIVSNIKGGFTVMEMRGGKQTVQEKIHRYRNTILLYQNLIAMQSVKIEGEKAKSESEIETILDELCAKTGKVIRRVIVAEPEDEDGEDDENVSHCITIEFAGK